MTISELAARILKLRDPRYRITAQLFDAQRRFIEDPAEWKAACCTRRAGKSHVATAGLLDAAFSHDNCDVLYLGLTRQSSEKIMWPKFHEMKSILGNKIELKNSKLCVETYNNSRVWLIGADSPGLIDRLLGNKWKRVIIDEAQSFGAHVEYLIDDVLSPALLDLMGDLWLLGTPGPIPNGYFYNAIANPHSSFARHKWSLFDNPHLPHAREWLEKLKKRKGWTEDNPTYRRQYLGEWCLDLDALVYRWSPTKNKASELPAGHEWNYVLGLDYGWHDQTAFALVAYSQTCPNAYILKCWGLAGLIPSRIAEIVQSLHSQYDLETIVCDTGGLGKSITEEFRQRYGLPVRAAEKTDKMAFIATLNGDFLDGRIFTLPGCEDLEQQYQTLTYDDRRKEDPSLRNDLCDSVLYSLRYARHYFAVERPEPLVMGSEAWIAREERDMIKAVEQATRAQQEKQTDPWGDLFT